MKNYSGSFIVPIVVSAVFTIVTIALMIWGIYGALGADVDCLSKTEARAKYPSEVIYWHTVKRCWNNIPVRAAHARTKPPPPADASGNATTRRARATSRPEIVYPALMGGGGTSSDMLHPGTFDHWPLIADFDADPPLFLPWLRVSNLINR